MKKEYKALENLLKTSPEEELENILKKSIVSNPLAEIDINTSEQSMDELASRGNNWVNLIVDECKDHEYGAPPCTVAMPDNRLLFISKVDEGLYSAFLQNNDETSGSYGEVLTQFQKMTPEAMVQAMKAKGYIPKEVPEEAPKADEKYSELAEALRNFSGKELHIHLHKN